MAGAWEGSEESHENLDITWHTVVEKLVTTHYSMRSPTSPRWTALFHVLSHIPQVNSSEHYTAGANDMCHFWDETVSVPGSSIRVSTMRTVEAHALSGMAAR